LLHVSRISKTKTIYTFPRHQRKACQERGFKILPAKNINVQLIKEHWDDILRFVKEFGRIRKSEFILRYIDILEFRQAIEKQFNKCENSNKFSKAVSFGNNHEFLHGDRVEQQIAEGCKRLIKNAIVCWNYVYATQLIAREPSPERRRELIEQLKRSSMATWKHVNLQENTTIPTKRWRIR
jgi:TnpA family transposase